MVSLKEREWSKRYEKSEKGKDRHRRYRLNHPDRVAFFYKRRYNQVRKEILELLGNRCNNLSCPIPPEKMNLLALQIDHINNNGNIHRRHKKNRSLNYYLSILREIKAGSKDYQILCVYCNWIKSRSNNHA